MARSESRGWWLVCGSVISALIFAGVLIGVSLKKLDSTQFGIKYNTIAKELLGVKGEGLYNGPPGFRFIIFPSIFKQEDLNVECVSRDGIYASCAVTFQWVVRRQALMDIVKKYKDFKTLRAIVRGAAVSSINDGCALFNVSQYQEQRTDVQLAQQSITRDRLNILGVDLAQLSLKNVEYPSEWSSAVSEKEKARQDISFALNERQQQLLIATTHLNISMQQAQVIVSNATRQAQEVLVNAQAQAHNIRYKYLTETSTLVAAKRALNLTAEGLLAYLTNRAISEGPSLDIAAEHPAIVSYQDVLAKQ